MVYTKTKKAPLKNPLNKFRTVDYSDLIKELAALNNLQTGSVEAWFKRPSLRKLKSKKNAPIFENNGINITAEINAYNRAIKKTNAPK